MRKISEGWLLPFISKVRVVMTVHIAKVAYWPLRFSLYKDYFSSFQTGFPCLLESPRFFLKFPGPGSYEKMTFALESPGN